MMVGHTYTQTILGVHRYGFISTMWLLWMVGSMNDLKPISQGVLSAMRTTFLRGMRRAFTHNQTSSWRRTQGAPLSLAVCS